MAARLPSGTLQNQFFFAGTNVYIQARTTSLLRRLSLAIAE